MRIQKLLSADEADSRRGHFILCRLPVLDRRAEGSSGGGKEQDTLIDFEEEIERFKPSLDVEAVEDANCKKRPDRYDRHYDGTDQGKRRK